MTSPQLPHFIRPTQPTMTSHATHRRTIDRSDLYVFLFFTAIFAVIIAHAR